MVLKRKCARIKIKINLNNSVLQQYVDDIFVIWNGSDDQLQQILSSFNSFQPALKFTLEVGGTKLNFVDICSLKLTPSNGNQKIGISIYRKPTFRGHFAGFYSPAIPENGNHKSIDPSVDSSTTRKGTPL